MPASNVPGRPGPFREPHVLFGGAGGIVYPFEPAELAGETVRTLLTVGDLTEESGNKVWLEARAGQTPNGQIHSAFPDGSVPINRIRLSDTTFTLNHGGGGAFSAWRTANEANSVFVYTDATTSTELSVASSRAGGGWFRWQYADDTFTNDDAMEFLDGIAAGANVVLVVATATE